MNKRDYKRYFQKPSMKDSIARLYNDLNCLFSFKLLLRKKNWEIHRNNPLLSKKINWAILHIFDKIKVSRVLLNTGIDIFVWRVTSNYTIRPFK